MFILTCLILLYLSYFPTLNCKCRVDIQVQCCSGNSFKPRVRHHAYFTHLCLRVAPTTSGSRGQPSILAIWLAHVDVNLRLSRAGVGWSLFCRAEESGVVRRVVYLKNRPGRTRRLQGCSFVFICRLSPTLTLTIPRSSLLPPDFWLLTLFGSVWHGEEECSSTGLFEQVDISSLSSSKHALTFYLIFFGCRVRLVCSGLFTFIRWSFFGICFAAAHIPALVFTCCNWDFHHNQHQQ